MSICIYVNMYLCQYVPGHMSESDLVVINVVITVINTSSIRSGSQCFRQVLHVDYWSDSSQWPTSSLH